MKFTSLLAISCFALLVTGCDLTDANLVQHNTHKVLIKEKIQNSAQRELGSYDNHCSILVLPENFGNVGDGIFYTNNMMYAAPVIKKSN